MTNPKTSICLLAALAIVMVQPLPARQQQGRTAGIARTSPVPSASDIRTIARDLSDKAQDAFNIAYKQRSRVPVELYTSLGGFAGSAKAYSQMAAEQREEPGLQSAARRLIAQAKEIDGLYSSLGVTDLQGSWRVVQDHATRLSNAYSLGYAGAGSGRSIAVPVSRAATIATPATGGRFRWRGRVDGSDYIMLQGSQVTIRHVDARYIQDASYELPAPLPQQALQLKLAKLKGRGNVEIVRQPTAENKYTLAVLIEDPMEGDDAYEFEVIWQPR